MARKPDYEALEKRNRELEQAELEHLQCEKEKKEDKEHYRSLLQNIQAAVVVHDADSKITASNPKARELLGLTEAQMLGKRAIDKDWKFLNADYEKMPVDQYPVNQVLNTRKIIRDLTLGIYRPATDDTVWVTINADPVFNDKRDITQVIVTFMDITDRKLAEKKLKKSEDRLRVILKTIPDPIVVYDANGYPLYLNAAFTLFFGWHLDELQGKLIPFVPKDQKKITGEKIKELYETGNTVRFETKRLTKNNETIRVLVSAAAIKDTQGRFKGFVVNLKDVTQQKKTEAQLRQAQKMEAIGTLSGGIAHDFNNILTGIFGYSHLAKKNIETPEKAIKYIDQIVNGATRATELIQQILAFSRQAEHKKNLLNISSVVKEALKLLRSSIPTTIEIRENIFSNAAVLADPIQIHQVIMNLCTNAYHAMHATGGILTVDLDQIRVINENTIPGLNILPGRYLELTVSDTGHGIDEETLKKIFDPYFTTKKSGEGTGIGLALVYGIVENHGGYVKVESVPGQGSAFHLFFPMAEQKEKTRNREENTHPQLMGTERVMVVDDEKAILSSTLDVLEYYGYKVSCFTDGQQAFNAFEKGPDQFDLILTDMAMPKMAGDELSKKILKIRKDLPIILWTGYNDNITEIKALAMGIKKYIKKPMDSQTLVFSIRQVLDSVPKP